MKIVFADRGWEDFTYWIEHDRKIAARIVRLIKEIEREPFEGLGKPEPLKRNLAGFWSRRIDDANRLVYKYENEELFIISCRFHYE